MVKLWNAKIPRERLGLIVPAMVTNPDLASLFSASYLSWLWLEGKAGAQKLRPSDCCFLPMRPIMILPQLRRREYLKSMPQRENFSPGDLLETTIYVVLEFPWRGKESKHYYLLIITPCYIWETLESEMSRDVPKSTQVVHGRDRIQRPVSLSPLLTTSTVQWSY